MLISWMHVNGLHVRESGMDGLCEDCILGKQTRHRFDGVHEVEKEVGEHSYLDLWGPAQVTSVGGKHYMFHIVEGHSGAPWTYYLAHKTAEESLAVFKLYKAEVEIQTGKKLRIIRVDGGREWINHLWERFCRAAGIIIRQVVQKPHKPHAASCGFLALCKAAGRISVSRTHKPTGTDSYKYHFECSVHAAIKSDPVNIMICP